MFTSAVKLAVARLLLAFLLASALFIGPTAAASDRVDVELEQSLNEFLALNVRDAEAADAAIAEIFEQYSARTLPVRSRVRLNAYYADSLFWNDEDRARELVSQALERAREARDPDAIAEALVTRMLHFLYVEDDKNALLTQQEIAPLLDALESPRIRYYVNQIVGSYLFNSKRREEALERYLAAYDAIDDTTNEARKPLRRLNLSSQMAQIQSELQNFDSALQMAERGIRQARGSELEAVFLPELLLLKGYIEGQQGLHEASIQSHEEAVRVGRQFERPDVVMISLNNIGSTLNDQDKHQEALELYQAALGEIPKGEGEDWGVELLEFNIGFSQVMLGNHQDGLAMLEEALPKMRESDSDATHVDTLKYVAEAYLEVGDFQKAVATLLEQRRLSNDVFESERQASLSELQTRFEVKEQVAEIALLEERNSLQVRVIENQRLRQKIVVLFVVVVLLSVVLLWQAWRSARRANSRLKHANKELKYQSSHDALTGLLNRRSFQREMELRAASGGERREQPFPDALLLLDVDYFKRVNDNFGHAAGDDVLVELGRRLKEASRSTDMVIRWGGEEVLLFLRNMDPAVLPEYAERVLHYIGATPVTSEGRSIHVTATGGFIPLPFDEISEADIGWERALQIADMALYLGKTQGRNRAIGVLELEVPLDQAHDALERDLGVAIDKDWVKTAMVLGPGAAEHR